MLKRLFIILASIIGFLVISVNALSLWFKYTTPTTKYSVNSLSISSDGRYVIGNNRTTLYLWDLEKRARTKIAKNVNIYSAYFVRNTDNYIYQDLNNIVHLKSVAGKELSTIKLDFPSYGHVMTTDMKRYYASDKDYRIVKVQDGVQTVIKGLDEPDGLYNGKFLDLQLSNDDKKLLSVGFSSGGPEDFEGPIYTEDQIPNLKFPYHLSSVAYWDLERDKPVLVFRGMSYKTTGAITPDDSRIIVADEGTKIGIIDPEKMKLFTFRDHFNSITFYPDNDLKRMYHVKKDPDKLWEGLRTGTKNLHYGTSSVSYISQNEYLKIIAYYPFAILYEGENAMPVTYFDLGNDPIPSVWGYGNPAIDTAPAVHRLVMGKFTEPGILVYDYDPEKKTLTKVWDSE